MNYFRRRGGNFFIKNSFSRPNSSSNLVNFSESSQKNSCLIKSINNLKKLSDNNFNKKNLFSNNIVINSINNDIINKKLTNISVENKKFIFFNKKQNKFQNLLKLSNLTCNTLMLTNINENKQKFYRNKQKNFSNKNFFLTNNNNNNNREILSKMSFLIDDKNFQNMIEKSGIFNIQNENSNSFSDEIFWEKKDIKRFYKKLKKIKEKVKEKKNKDYNHILDLIKNNKDDEITNILFKSKFKKFYRNKDELFSSDFLVKPLIKNNKFVLLKKILKNNSYSLNENFIFHFILECLINKLKIQKKIKDKRPKSLFVRDLTLNIKKKNSNCKTTVKFQKFENKFLKDNENSNNDNNKNIFIGLINYNLYPKEEIKIKILAWIFAYFKQYESFRKLLKKNPQFFLKENERFDKFEITKSIDIYCEDDNEFQKTLENCLKCKFEKLAIILCEFYEIDNINEQIFLTASKTGNMLFLKYHWEKNNFLDFDVNNNSNSKNYKKNFNLLKNSTIISSESQKNFENLVNSNNFFKNKKTQFISLNKIINQICSNYNNVSKPKEINDNLSKILKWKNIEKDKTLIDSLFKNNCFEQISNLIFNQKIPEIYFLKENYFKEVIKKQECELILYYLHKREMRIILTDKFIQKIIVVNYVPFGDKLYYASEMLLYIYYTQWDPSLTKNLCINIINNIKSQEILNCHSPILTCLLLSEFISKIKELDVINISLCEKVQKELIDYCKEIQESNTDESYIEYLMTQKDTKDRTAFKIASDNSYYSLLEMPQIGTIIRKMWDGNINNNGLFIASSLFRYITETERTENDPFNSFDILDENKIYFFQISVWLDSCSLRFSPRLISSIFMIFIYNLSIFYMNKDGELLNNWSELNKTLKYLLSCYIFCVCSLPLKIFWELVFIFKVKRTLIINYLNYLDFCLFFFGILILFDTKTIINKNANFDNLNDIFGDYLFNLHLSIIKEFKIDYNKFIFSIPFYLRVLILIINDLLVWLRVCGVLLTYKKMGPIIKILMSMTMFFMKYLIIIVIFLAMSASLFTILFNKYSNSFIDFSTSVITLFGAFLNDFDMMNFDEKRIYLGSMLFLFYASIAGVLLVNLLIAVLSNVFEEMAKFSAARHRSNLIQYYKNYNWDKNYGFINFLITPFNFVNFIFFPIEEIFVEDKEKFNDVVTNCYYFVFYFPAIFLVFVVGSVVVIPVCYVKGIIKSIFYNMNLKIFKLIKIKNILFWVLFGIFYLIFVFLRDCFYCVKTVFKKIDTKISDIDRIKKNLSKENVITFLKFLHSELKKEDLLNLHTLFLSYLQFEQSEKKDSNAKKNSNYIYNLNQVSSSPKKRKSSTKNQLFFIYGKNSSKKYTSYIRKNLMILEILENFVVDNENEKIVDIEKMRKLFPFTTNIQNYYFRRLVHCNVHVLNQAMEKLKYNKSTFLQYQLIERIMSIAQRLDKEIDSEILKIFHKNEHKKDDLKIKNIKNVKFDDEKKLIDFDDVDNNNLKNKNENKYINNFEKIIKDLRMIVVDIINNKLTHSNSSTMVNKSDFSSNVSNINKNFVN